MSALDSLYHHHVHALQAATEQALASAGFDALILASGSASSKNRFDDQSWPLSPTPAFLHWVPLPEPDAYLVIRPGVRPRLIRTLAEDYWEAPTPPDSDHFLAEVDAVTVPAAAVAGELALPGRVAVICRDDQCAAAGTLNPAALIAALDQIRTRKSDYELYCLAQATEVAARGHRKVAELFAAGDPSELQLHLAYLTATDQDDAQAPYKGIVAVGEHAAILHWVSYQRRASGRPDTSLLVDAGARHLGYGCDITRTYARGAGAAARRFADCIQRLDVLQRQVCARIEVGMEYEALHDYSHELLGVALVELGLGKGDPATLVARGVTRALFPHGLGHSLGIVTHDVGMKLRAPRPDNQYLRNTSRVEVGQVFTIEPGLYVIDQLLAPLRADDRRGLLDWDALATLAPFGGIRIEDNLAVTARGVVNLTRQALA
ncbi:MAG: Xaa-Pro dipeptidase [Kofleriaceae bacterium]|nr:Xaa-Pro dipeptidase [Kofleriaceae bacterium]MBP6838378.1 Xaa-Pro dipeptidase [Kofleriaceae bacterium]